MSKLTEILPDLQVAVETVGEQMTGLIAMAMRDSKADAVHKGQTVKAAFYKQQGSEPVVPSMTRQEKGEPDYTPKLFTIDNIEAATVDWNGETTAYANSLGILDETIRVQIETEMLGLVSKIEKDMLDAALAGLTNPAVGDGTVDMFANPMPTFAKVNKVLNAGLTPRAGRSMALTPDGLYSLQSNAPNLFKANENGNRNFLTGAELGTVYNLGLTESYAEASILGELKTQTPVDNANVGDTLVRFPSLNADNVGDIVIFSDAPDEQYILISYDEGTGIGDDRFELDRPLTVAIGGSTITDVYAVGGNVAGVAGSKDALMLCTRTPHAGDDMAKDVTIVQDPKSKLAFRVAWYPGSHMSQLEISIAWGTHVANDSHYTVVLSA